jgi:hypothetical protein
MQENLICRDQQKTGGRNQIVGITWVVMGIGVNHCIDVGKTKCSVSVLISTWRFAKKESMQPKNVDLDYKYKC